MTERISTPKAWLMLGLMVVVGLAVGNLIGIMLLPAELRMEIFSGSANLGDRDVLAKLRLYQGVSSVFTFLIPPIVFNYWYRKERMDILGIHPKASINLYFISTVAIFASIAWINAVMSWSSGWNVPDFFEELQNQNEYVLDAFLDMRSQSDLWWNLTVMALIPALGEEFLFRGAIQPLLKKSFRSGYLAVWITAFLFAAMHMQIKSFLAMLLLGAFLGHLRLYGKSIWLSVTAHYVNNAMMVIAAYVLLQQGISLDALDAPGSEDGQLWMAIFSFAFMVGSVWIIRKLQNQP